MAQTGSHVDAQRTSTIVARPLDLGATCDLGRQRRTVADAVAAAEGSTWRGAAAREARILRSKPPAAAETRIPERFTNGLSLLSLLPFPPPTRQLHPPGTFDRTGSI